MAQHILLNIDDLNVKGESQISGHEDWIDLDSYSLDFHQSGSFHRGGGGAGGGVAVGDLMLTKKLDASSINLMKNVCKGSHYKKVVLEVLKNIGDNKMETYYKIEMTDVIVSSYNVGGAKDGNDFINESFSFNFRHIKTEYHKQEKDGTLSQVGEMTYDAALGEADV